MIAAGIVSIIIVTITIVITRSSSIITIAIIRSSIMFNVEVPKYITNNHFNMINNLNKFSGWGWGWFVWSPLLKVDRRCVVAVLLLW